jgi:hypothetical protein
MRVCTTRCLESTSSSARRSRWTLRRARRLVTEAPRPALRVPGARSAKGASTTGRRTTHYAEEHPRPPKPSDNGGNPLECAKSAPSLIDALDAGARRGPQSRRGRGFVSTSQAPAGGGLGLPGGISRGGSRAFRLGHLIGLRKPRITATKRRSIVPVAHFTRMNAQRSITMSRAATGRPRVPRFRS